MRAVNDVDVRYVTVELSCFYCGHSCSVVRVPGTERPTNHALRAACAEAGTARAPAWDAHGQPRCPRCNAKLFIERSEQRRAYSA